jgi:ion channel POLLUX/CASTOR
MSSRVIGHARDRIRYTIDNALARGLWVILVWMAVALFGSVILVGSIIWATNAGPGDQPVPYLEGIWIALTRSLDPGTFGQDSGAHFRVAALVITVIGLLAIALLIGLFSSAVDSRLDDLRQGRSIVLEEGHTLVLGTSGKLPLVMQELVEAGSGKPHRVIVILSPQDKVEIEHLLKREVHRRQTRFVVRRGEPSSIRELSQVRPEHASSVVILRPDGHDADAVVVQVALAICKVRAGLDAIPIIAELQDPDVARGLRQALGSQIMTVVSGEVVARAAAQISRAAGLGTLYQELLDFDGDEIYLANVPESLHGRPFGDALLASPACSVLGVLDSMGKPLLCPSFDRLLDPADQLILVGADESAVTFHSHPPTRSPKTRLTLSVPSARQERILLIGWNAMAQRIVEELDHHVAPGSALTIMIDPQLVHEFESASLESLHHSTISIRRGSMIDRQAIDNVVAEGPFDHIIVLCPHEVVSHVQADSRALLAVLHVRNSLQERGGEALHANVVTEVMQSSSVDLAQVARPDDFIVSQRLVSLLIAQLAEDPRRKEILHELLGSGGAQLRLHRVEAGQLIGRFTYASIIDHMRPMGVIVLGWRARSYARHPASLGGGMRVNPEKDECVDLAPGDHIILLVHERQT